MSVQQPQDMNQVWANAFNAGHLEEMLSLYESDAVYVPQPGAQPARGLTAIKSGLRAFLAMNPTIEFEQQYCLTCGDVALLRANFQLRGTSADGQPFELKSATSEVLHRQADGSWKYVIDHPFGAGSMPIGEHTGNA